MSNMLIGIQALIYVPDQIPPSLTNYSLNMDTGLLRLTFSDVIDPQTFTATQYTLRNM